MSTTYYPWYASESNVCLTDSTAECPHCRHTWRVDDWYPGDEETMESQCPNCEKFLNLVAQHSITIYACPEKVEVSE